MVRPTLGEMNGVSEQIFKFRGGRKRIRDRVAAAERAEGGESPTFPRAAAPATTVAESGLTKTRYIAVTDNSNRAISVRLPIRVTTAAATRTSQTKMKGRDAR